MIRVLIADDEGLARQRLRTIVEALPEGAEVTECGDGADAVTTLRQRPFDLALLDIRMPELDGLEVVRAIGAVGMPPTIFVTAHDQYAITAFEVRAADYVRKPFDPGRVHAAIDHALSRGPGRELLTALVGEHPRPPSLTRIAVRHDGKMVVVPVTDIAWIEAADNYVRLHAAGSRRGEILRVRGKLAAFEARLEPAQFVRIHRSAIVNLAHVREISPWFHGDQQIVLSTGEELTVSRTHRGALFESLGIGL